MVPHAAVVNRVCIQLVIRPFDALLTDNAGCCARMNKTFCTRTRASVSCREQEPQVIGPQVLLGDTVEAVRDT